MITVKEVVDHAKTIANGEHDVVKPGMPMSFSEANDVGEAIWQGDLGIGLTSGGPPKGYKKVKPSKFLVPNAESIGSMHCLESLEGVEMWVPQVWDETSLEGPYLKLANGAKVTHPKHGDVTIPSCFSEVQTFYQREWDAEQARERRAAD